jgi:hypothetical protein
VIVEQSNVQKRRTLHFTRSVSLEIGIATLVGAAPSEADFETPSNHTLSSSDTSGAPRPNLEGNSPDGLMHLRFDVTLDR